MMNNNDTTCREDTKNIATMGDGPKTLKRK